MQKKYKRTPASINLENKQSAIKSVSVFAVVIVIILLWPYSILSWQSICFLTILFVYLFSEVVSYISRKKNTSNLEIYFSSECIFFHANQYQGNFKFENLSIKTVDRKDSSITRIVLLQKGGQDVVIKGFESMDEILHCIEERLKRKHEPQH